MKLPGGYVGRVAFCRSDEHVLRPDPSIHLAYDSTVPVIS